MSAWARCGIVALVLCLNATALSASPALAPADQAPVPSEPGPALTEVQSLFYGGRYEAAAALAAARHASEAEDLANHELWSSALLYQIKALLPDRSVKKAPLESCGPCPALVADFLVVFRRGQSLARAALRRSPDDPTALFFLGKLDLSYVWLQLGPLRRKTGWDEYWEARRSLDAVLKDHPDHVRARVARAWIDYIVDTRMPWGTRWVLGGGNRKQALVDVVEAVRMPSDFFSHAEAEFTLWDMLVREREMAQATDVARRLARDFPDNRSIAAFIEAREADSRR